MKKNYNTSKMVLKIYIVFSQIEDEIQERIKSDIDFTNMQEDQ